MTVEARQQAVEALYEADQRELTEAGEGLPARVERMVSGVLLHRQELDDSIDAVSDHWRINRMPVVDRAILRLGLYELLYEPNTPPGVVVAEAVRLAKLFGTEKSGAFVNGVLSALVHQVSPPGGGSGPKGRGGRSPSREDGAPPSRLRRLSPLRGEKHW